MPLNRRGFLRSLLGAGVLAHELDVEKLLWVPGERKIFIPPAEPKVHIPTIRFVYGDYVVYDYDISPEDFPVPRPYETLDIVVQALAAEHWVHTAAFVQLMVKNGGLGD